MTLFGYDQGVFSGTVVTEDFLVQHGILGKPKIISTVTAIYDIGCFFGALLVVAVGDKLGRKKCVLVGTTIMAIGAALQTTSYSLAQMFVGRIVAGVGNGINTATAPVWQSDSSKTSWRGKLIVIEMVMNIFGFMMVNWINYGLSFVGGPIAWRVPLALQFLFIIILYATVPWLPESPRWLIFQGRDEEATVIIALLEDKDPMDPWIVTQVEDIKWAVDYERKNSVSWADLLRGRTEGKGGTATLRRIFLGMGSQAMQQFSGINVTSYYLPTVLIESVGLTNQMARLLTACNGVSYLVFASFAVFFIERWGRRKLMMGGAAGQAFCYIFITVCLSQAARYEASGDPITQERWASASIAFFFLYYVFFGFGWQGVPWLYPAEINSLAMRAKGAGLGVATNWIVNFLVVEITPPGIASLAWKFYIIWAVFNTAFVPLVYLFYPETAGRNLEDVDRYFKENPDRILVFRDKEATSSKRPAAYEEQEQAAYRRNSSVATERHASWLEKHQMEEAVRHTDM
ncbi:general substrate transporter [Polychaeton citri CBS 116435]|uniref:General substrate transporter n=1 Tax=Polychaeton citri CBS 116435 TaxID=1314669 RepID=A0A9P4Q5G7_9PEZI|nr:general substrate transporter [Polychaeton citri CBS 116435]